MIRQSWEFDLSIFDLSIFWIFLKDRPWSNRSRRSLNKIESIESLPLIFEKDRKDRIALKKRAIPRWKNVFFYVFDRCSPFLCQIESIPTMRSLRWKKPMIEFPTLWFGHNMSPGQRILSRYSSLNENVGLHGCDIESNSYERFFD